jgi:very-short-patch-repair endonuclease
VDSLHVARFVQPAVVVFLIGRIVSRADFAFPAEKVAVFCDGARYHLQQDQWQRDLRQRRQLVRLGWRCLAFTGAEILEDAGRKCVQEILVFLGRAPETPGLSATGSVTSWI